MSQCDNDDVYEINKHINNVYSLIDNNHLFVPTLNTLSETLLQIPKLLRHKGLFVTYLDNESKLPITIQYQSNDICDEAFMNNNNWIQSNGSNNIVLSIGEVKSGDEAKADIRVAGNNIYKLDLVLPKGDKGDTGDKGDKGDNGINGINGTDASYYKNYYIEYNKNKTPDYLSDSNTPGYNWTENIPDFTNSAINSIWITSAKFDSNNTRLSNWSKPVIYIQYGQNGINGKDGKNGIDGRDGIDGKDGQDGTNGLNGPIIYPVGIYDAAKKYIKTEQLSPYVLFIDKYYYLNTNMEWIGVEQDETPNNSKYWTELPQYEAILVKYGIIDNGTFGSMVFNGNWVFSKIGIDIEGNTTDEYFNFNMGDAWNNKAQFRPSIAMNMKTGEVWFGFGNYHVDTKGNIQMNNAEITGTIKKNFVSIDVINNVIGASINLKDFADIIINSSTNNASLYIADEIPEFVEFNIYVTCDDFRRTTLNSLGDTQIDRAIVTLKFSTGFTPIVTNNNCMFSVNNSNQTNYIDWQIENISSRQTEEWTIQYNINRSINYSIPVGAHIKLIRIGTNIFIE